jgi:hypothetical protein
VGSSLAGLGLQAALRGRDAVSAAIGTGIAIAAVAATLVFATAVGAVVDQPERYGWSVDYAFLSNYGYGPIDADAITTDLDRPDVERWGIAAALSGDITVNGETVPAIAGRAGFDEVAAGFPVVEGRSPAGDDEVALGSSTARDLEVDVGDEVTLGSPFGEVPVTVAGLVVLPELGQFQSDRTSLADGVLVPEGTLEAAMAGAQEATGTAPSDLADLSAGIVLVDLVDGTTGHDLEEALGDRTDAWAPYGFGVSYADPIRAPAIVDLDAVQGAPAALAGLFALGMAGAVTAGLAAGTRGRRQELAVVRALGATRRQRRWSVRVHALTTIVVGLVVGVPLGVAAGRVAFRRLAADLGVADDVATSVVVVGGVVATALLAAVVVAEVLARLAVVERPLPVIDPEVAVRA